MNNETKISSLKYLITLVFDKLINKIDIFIETQLKTLNEKSVSSNDKVVDFLRSKDNYFNLLRDVFINEIELVKKDSFKNAVESFEEYSGDIEIFLASNDIKDGFNIMKTFCFLVQQLRHVCCLFFSLVLVCCLFFVICFLLVFACNKSLCTFMCCRCRDAKKLSRALALAL